MARKLVVEIVGDASSLERSLTRADRGAAHFTRNMEKAGRGAIAGTGLFRGFGRSIAFASGGFLAFASAGQFLRDSVNAAREAAVAQRSLGAQMKANGELFKTNRERIEQATRSYAKFGFQNDEVIASLTVLDRGTGNINQALKLQGLVADLARAKNIDLAAAATTVAKVFGGQETALRRAVPGLSKTAHGYDLIREAQAKLAGQAAAGTTSAERFAAQLHDTEEILGGALLPTLNHYLDSLSEWMANTRNQHELARQMKQVLGALDTALGVVTGAFKDLNKVTGSTKHSLELLLGAFVAFKTLRLVSSLAEIAGNISLIGSRAATARGQVGGFIGALGGPRAAAGGAAGGAALALSEQGEQLTFRGKRPPAFLVAGMTPLGAGWYLSGSHYLRWNPASGKFDRDQTSPPSILGRRPPGALGPARHVAGPDRGTAAAAVPASPTAKTLSRIFDTQIDRLTSRATYGTLQQQLAKLQQVAGLLSKRIAVTKDITRRLDLEDKALGVGAQIKQIRQQLVQSYIDALQFDVTKAGATTTLTDDLAALRKLQGYLQQRVKVAGRNLDLEQQLFDVQQQINDVLKQQAEQRAAAQEARQFRVLGLGATGDALIPGVRQLRRQLNSVREAIEGSFLDTRKTRSMLSHIRTVLSGGLGAVGRDVRAKIQEILNGVSQQLKQHQVDVTRFHKADPLALLGGLGLTAEQRKALRVRLSTLGPGGTVPSPSRQFAAAGAGGIYVAGNVHLHGVQDVKALEQQLTKRSKQRQHVRRGAR